jgi:4-carboxymuconolactone decarboxylase
MSYGAIWSRPGLALVDRMVCALATLGAVHRLPKLRHHIDAALGLGLSARSIVEILIQTGIYAGFAASEEAVETAGTVVANRGLAMPEETARDDTLEALTARGRQLMGQLHGDRATQG